MWKRIMILPLTLFFVGLCTWGFDSPDTEVTEIKEATEINWVSMEQAAAAAEKDGKKILVDMYTDWCGWCKRMDRDTYEKAEIIEYINKNYHAVKFNAEQKEDVTVNGTTYKYNAKVGRRGAHDLAIQILNGRLSYPTTSFLNPDLSIITNVPGYQNAQDMIIILSFLAEEAYKDNISFDTYKANYAPSN